MKPLVKMKKGMFMASYIEPIRFALIVFPFLALAISSFFSFMNIESMERLFFESGYLIFVCFLFVMCLFLIILPLPSKEAVAQMTGPKMELHLFASWVHFRENTVLVLSDPSTYLPAMRQSVF